MKTQYRYALAYILYYFVAILAALLRLLYSILSLIAPSFFLQESGQFKRLSRLWKLVSDAETWAAKRFFEK